MAGGGGNGQGGMTGSGGDTSSSSTSTGVKPPANDQCPGEAVTLNLDETKTVSGTTDGAKDDYSSTCGDTDAGDGAPDVVYAITLMGDGSFKAKVTAADGSALNPSLNLRMACETNESPEACVDNGTSKVEFLSGELKAGTYYLVVEGVGGTSGAFDLTLSSVTPACGDHVLNAGEQCDPPGPGCADGCTFQVAPNGQDKCPAVGDTFAVPAIGITIPDQYTTGFADNYTPTSCAMPGMGGPDRVYQLVPEVDGMMTVRIGYDVDGKTSVCDQDPESTGCFDRVLYARTTCVDAASEVACANTGIYAPEEISFPVLADGQYYIFVDGASEAAFGTYTLLVGITP